MPRTRSLAWAELKIGLLSVTALAIAAASLASVAVKAGNVPAAPAAGLAPVKAVRAG